MATKQIKRYQVTLQVGAGDEVDAIKAVAKSAIKSKLAEDGSAVEGI